MHCGAAPLAGWPDAASGDKSSEGQRRLGLVIGLMSSALGGHCHLLSWTSMFTSNLGKSRWIGEAHSISAMIDRMALLREVYAPREDRSPGMIGFEACESLPALVRNKKAIAEKHFVRRFLSTQQPLDNDELDNAYGLLGAENAAGGLAEVTRDMVALRRMLQWGSSFPGALHPLRGASSQANGSGR